MMPNLFLKKVTNNYTKKSNHPKIFIKIKKNVPKKITSSKNKINYDAQALKNQKKKKFAYHLLNSKDMY